MFSLPDSLVGRMKSTIPPGERSQVIARMLEREIELREKTLFQAAQELEGNLALHEEMQSWDEQFGDDGLENV